MTRIDEIHPRRREPRGSFPRHTDPADLPADLRRPLTLAAARRRARDRLNAWLEAHGLDPLPECE